MESFSFSFYIVSLRHYEDETEIHIYFNRRFVLPFTCFSTKQN